MTRVFRDVGAHDGQTLDEVTQAGYQFDRIYAFEPMPAQFAHLNERFAGDHRVTLCNYGLAAKTGPMALYGTNDQMEASIHPTKNDVDPDVVTECDFVEASAFFAAHLTDSDHVVMKLNCEGAEIDIRKVAGFEHQERDLLDRLNQAGFARYRLSEDVMVGETHQDRIAHWLSL